jgi:hypothetical protein
MESVFEPDPMLKPSARSRAAFRRWSEPNSGSNCELNREPFPKIVFRPSFRKPTN